MDIKIENEIFANKKEISRLTREIILSECYIVLSSIFIGLCIGKIIWG